MGSWKINLLAFKSFMHIWYINKLPVLSYKHNFHSMLLFFSFSSTTCINHLNVIIICYWIKTRQITCSIIGNIDPIKTENYIRWLQNMRFWSCWFNSSNTHTFFIGSHTHWHSQIRIFHLLPLNSKDWKSW